MSDDLFHPVGVNTCILVFKAHAPHSKGKKSFFGYFKNDGRVDKNKKWNEIKEKWLSSYINKESIAGMSVTKEITAEDEWCAEAYMETDYSTLTEEDFVKVIRDFVAFKVKYDD